MRLYWGAAAAACAWALLLALPTHAQPAPRPAADELKHVVTRGIEFLRKAQAADGSFSRHIGGPGVTGLVVAALVRHGVPANDPMLQKALKFLEGSVQKDGGIYEKRLANYTTSIAVMALKEANADGKYNQIIDNAIRFLKTLQHGDGLTPADPSYGGVGYDATSRPDMSNMNFFVDALVAAGVPKDDPALKRTVTFLSHCQNLPGEHNKLPWVGKVSDADRGGFVYSPHGIRGKTAEGGLRSEGAMTYAGLKRKTSACRPPLAGFAGTTPLPSTPARDNPACSITTWSSARPLTL